MIDDLSTVFQDGDGQRTSQKTTDGYVANSDSVATPKPLTSKQEAKLRSFLDGALENITRGYRKRYDPSSPLHTLSSYLAEWMRLLSVLARVPPYGSGSTNLLISYLLRCSTDLCDGITGYSLAMEVEVLRKQAKSRKVDQSSSQRNIGRTDTEGKSVDDGDDGDDRDDRNNKTSDLYKEEERQHQTMLRTKQLNLVLQTLDLLDRVWTAVLRGNLVDFPVALSNARKAFPEPASVVTVDGEVNDMAKQQQAHHPYRPATIHSASLVPSPAIDGRFTSSTSFSAGTTPRESVPVHGGRGNKTMDVTDQVRLRNIAISSREKLFSWMRTELQAPPPPVIAEDDPEHEPSDNTVEGALGIRKDPDPPADTEEVEDPEFEDVAIGDKQPDEEGYDAADDTEEHKHYQDLFERRIDPDDDNDDDNVTGAPGKSQRESEEHNTDQRLGASVLGTRDAVTSHGTHEKRKREDELEEQFVLEERRADGLPSKRSRAPDTDAEEAEVKMSRSEMGSIDFDLSDTVGQWDMAFTRLFSRTLRTLSYLSDFAKRSAKLDFTSSLSGISGADEQETTDDRS